MKMGRHHAGVMEGIITCTVSVYPLVILLLQALQLRPPQRAKIYKTYYTSQRETFYSPSARKPFFHNPFTENLEHMHLIFAFNTIHNPSNQ